MSAGGTHELLLFKLPLPFISFGGPGDHIEKELLDDPNGSAASHLAAGRLVFRFFPDGKRVVVTNYLRNSLQIADLDLNTVTRTISLGGPAEPHSRAKAKRFSSMASGDLTIGIPVIRVTSKATRMVRPSIPSTMVATKRQRRLSACATSRIRRPTPGTVGRRAWINSYTTA